jgi:molybdate transport system substrate-binding protein
VLVLYLKFLLFIFCFSFLSCANAQTIKVAVAANFAQPMKALIKSYEQQSSTKVTLITGSSGKLYAQIMHGAPFDLFFSADQDKVDRLETKDKIIPSTRFTYAQGHLVLWSKQVEKPLLKRLNSGDFNYVSIANPKHAPYGVAAMEYLNAINKAADKKQIIGENISQAFQYAYSGSADLGLVALSQVITLPTTQGIYERIPEHLTTPILQDAALLSRSKDKQETLDFLAFVKSPIGQNIIERFGYTNVPQGER